EICQRTLDLASGTPEEAQVGAETCLLLGAAFAKRNWLQEAAVAWDAGAEKYPTGDMAPDCLWKAVNCYVQLNGQDSRPFYKERIKQRMATLASRYPKHPGAVLAQLVDGQQLEAEQKFLEAAAAYERVQEGTPGYEEAQYRAGNAYYRQARKLAQDGKD